MPSRVSIEVTTGQLQGKRFTFDEPDIFLLGRSPDCHVSLPTEAGLSGLHFLIDINPPQAHLRAQSRSTTYVNSTPLIGTEHPLKDGDRIRAGSIELLVRTEEFVHCLECGRAIFNEEKNTAQWSPGVFLCSDCFSQGVTLKLLDPISRPLQCESCGKVVAGQSKPNNMQSYVCLECSGNTPSLLAPISPEVLQETVSLGLPPPVPIAGYEILKVLGVGGMGVVYLARRQRDSAKVAIKLLQASVGVEERQLLKFVREIQSVQGLDHPSIIEFVEFGGLGASFYFVMRYCEGGDLYELLKTRGYYDQSRINLLTLQEAVSIFLPILDGLSYAHSRGVVHRDIKPKNIFFKSKQGEGATLADFGLAKNFQQAGLSRLTFTHENSGTPQFMPKEQLTRFKYLLPRADVFSVGATLYHMLTGLYPYHFRKGFSPIEVILYEPIISIGTRLPQLSTAVAEVIDRAIAVDAEARYETATEFVEALQNALDV